jgi:hypothetical protein
MTPAVFYASVLFMCGETRGADHAIIKMARARLDAGSGGRSACGSTDRGVFLLI